MKWGETIFEDEVGAFCIVPKEPLHEFLIKEVWIFQIVGVVINELFLNGAIESFTVRVHLRRFRIRVIVGEMETRNFIGKMLFEFRTVVSKDEGKRDREYFSAVSEKFLGGL